MTVHVRVPGEKGKQHLLEEVEHIQARVNRVPEDGLGYLFVGPVVFVLR